MADDREPVYEEDVAGDVEQTFDGLVEAWEDLEEADRLLAEFKASVGAPRPLPFFESREQLTDFVTVKREYDRRLGEVTADQAGALKLYHQAVERADAILPNNTALTYDYRGRRGPLRGTRYIIRSQPNIPNWDYRSERYAKIGVEVQSRPKPKTSP